MFDKLVVFFTVSFIMNIVYFYFFPLSKKITISIIHAIITSIVGTLIFVTIKNTLFFIVLNIICFNIYINLIKVLPVKTSN
jgi:hypothetical protein